MNKKLFVKCPECGVENDLGEEAVKTYLSSFAFFLNRKCEHCGILFIETDTNEADYRIAECDRCNPTPNDCPKPEHCGYVGGDRD